MPSMDQASLHPKQQSDPRRDNPCQPLSFDDLPDHNLNPVTQSAPVGILMVFFPKSGLFAAPLATLP